MNKHLARLLAAFAACGRRAAMPTMAALMALAALAAGTSRAATPAEWKDMTYSHLGRASDLGLTLDDFCKTMGLRLELTPADLALRPTESPGGAANPAAFLNRLATRHGFSWFVHAGVLYVDGEPQLPAQRLELRGSSPAAVKQALIGLGLFEPRFGWGELEERPPVVLLSGPRTYIDLVRETIPKLAQEPAQDTQIMVFQIKHASVADYETTVRDKVTRHPGLASVLRSLMSEDAGPEPRTARAALEGFKSPVQEPRAGNDGSTPARRLPSSPSVEAFPAINALVVRDTAQRRPLYEQVIAALDQPLRQVEIFATVVDAQSGTLREWALDLGIASGRSRAQSQLRSASATAVEPATVLWSSVALDLRLRALESEGKARIVSRPSVLALDNRGALLDLSKTAYLRLEGERVADVKQITVGNLLSVTPRVVPGDAGASILLDVNIEDGAIGASETFPQATRNTIATQALLGPGQSLVIGGYQQEQTEVRNAAVPGLSAIPLLGALFRSDYKEGTSRERIYVISARIVGAPEAPIRSR